MSQISESRTLVRPLPTATMQHVVLMRPELPSLLVEIVAEVCASVPGYEALLDGPLGDVLRQCVQRNVSTFVARIGDPEVASPERDELCRTVGRLEALNGHSMDRLQTAYRVGAQVAWRRWVKVARRHSIPTPVVSGLADALFSYVDEMTSLSREGHTEGRVRSGRLVGEHRERLLSRLIAGEPTSPGVLAELAERAAWPLPEEATPVVVEAPDSGFDRSVLGGDVLARLDGPRPCLLIPGPMTAARDQMLARFLGAVPSAHAVVGLTVPLSEVAHSVRWARRTFAVTGSLGSEGRLVHSEDHLLSLWLDSDPELFRHIAELQLAPLQGFSDGRRDRLIDTLLAWFSTRGNVEQMAKQLEVHPQTIRYRMRALDKTLGPLLGDPEWRLATELALRGRTVWARERSDRPEACGG